MLGKLSLDIYFAWHKKKNLPDKKTNWLCRYYDDNFKIEHCFSIYIYILFVYTCEDMIQ